MEADLTLKSLEEHNAGIREIYTNINKATPNGIACPKCGAELRDTNPGILLTSNPPQHYVGCEKCGYSGTRL